MFRDRLETLINQAYDMAVSGKADNIRDGFLLIKKTKPDIAIVDVSLKGSNGLELLTDLRAHKIDLPVLVLSGDLDEETSPGDNHRAAAALGPSVTFVSVPNEIHVPALLDPFDCASAIVVGFVRHPGTANLACTRRIPEFRTVGVFPLHLSDQPASTALPGNTASIDDLRLAAVAVEALGDALTSAGNLYYDDLPNCGPSYCGPGLRGGTIRASGDLSRNGTQSTL